jgi:hypothetical protein
VCERDSDDGIRWDRHLRTGLNTLELGNKYNNHNNPYALKWTSLNIG